MRLPEFLARSRQHLLIASVAAGSAFGPAIASAEDLRLGVFTQNLTLMSQSQITQALASTWFRTWKESSNKNIRLVSVINPSGADILLGPAEAIIQGCKSGELVPTSIRTKIRTGSLLRRSSAGCGVAVLSQQVNLGFRRDVFANVAPAKVEALFDLDAFPGKRALIAGPDTLIEWALMSFGVPHRDLYQLLSTERGLKLVFQRLDLIRDQTIWCKHYRCTRRALESKEASMAMLDHAASATLRTDPAMGIVEAASITDRLELAVVNGPRIDDASGFANFAQTDAQIDALSASSDLLGSVRTTKTLVRDSLWYAHTRERLAERFSRWLGAKAIRSK